MLGLQLFSLNEHAPTIDRSPVLVDRGQLKLIHRQDRRTLAPQLVDHHVAHYPPDPSVGPRGVTYLVRSFQSALQRDLKHLLGVETPAAPTADEGEELVPMGPQSSAHAVERVVCVALRFHRVRQAASSFQPFQAAPVERNVSRRPPSGLFEAPHCRVAAQAMETTNQPSSQSCVCHATCNAQPSRRGESVGRALRLEYLTLTWNVVEGFMAIGAALMAGSVAILGFGIDSFVECASAAVMIWRLRAERDHRLSGERLEAVEQQARRLVAVSLFVLAAYVTFDAVQTLWLGDKPSFSPVGVALLVLSIAVMLWLARAKRQLADELGSEAMEADATQTTACWWLSLAALAGVGLNGLLGWWWADPLAALAIAALIVREGREAWRGKACC